MAETGVLHFYPGARRIVWVVRGAAALNAEAWGGQEVPDGSNFGLMRPHRTTPGRFVIHSYGPYRTNSWPMARIPWGTPLKVEGTGALKHVVFQTGTTHQTWKRVESLIPQATYLGLQGYYRMLYGDSGRYDPDRDGIPDRWVFNEFGPKAVRYFKDLNNDGVLDGNEHLMGDMIHTVPSNEAETLLKDPIKYTVSHGCVHIAPRDRDRLLSAGAFKKGTTFIVHGYNERVPLVPRVQLPEAPAPTETQTGRLEKEKTFFDVLIVDDDDEPLAGQRYRLELADGTVEEGRLGADGRLARRNIDPGTAELTLLADEAPPVAAEEAPAPEPAEPEAAPSSEPEAAPGVPEVPLDAPVALDTVDLQLIDVDGKPVAGQKVSIQLADGSVREAVTDDDGAVTIADVPGGDYVLSIVDSDTA